MDFLLSLLCGALGGLALGDSRSRKRLSQFLAAALGLAGGWFAAEALDALGLGLAHSPAPGGALDPTALAVQAIATAGTGAGAVWIFSQVRRVMRR